MTPTLSNAAVWAFTADKVVLWLLVMTRLTGLLSAMPLLGATKLPLQVRVALAVLVSLVLVPGVPAPAVLSTGIPALLSQMASELAVGLVLGTVVAWIIEAVAFAGGLMDMQMGFSFVQFLDPSTAQNTSVSASFMVQAASVLVFVTGLHRVMILALVDSFRVAPLGQGVPLQVMGLVILLGQLLVKGFQLAFPVLAVLFLMDLLLAISGKFMPQLQLLQLSFPLKIAMGLVILGLMLRQLGPWLIPLFERAPRIALRLLG